MAQSRVDEDCIRLVKCRSQQRQNTVREDRDVTGLDAHVIQFQDPTRIHRK